MIWFENVICINLRRLTIDINITDHEKHSLVNDFVFILNFIYLMRMSANKIAFPGIHIIQIKLMFDTIHKYLNSCIISGRRANQPTSETDNYAPILLISMQWKQISTFIVLQRASSYTTRRYSFMAQAEWEHYNSQFEWDPFY